MKPKGLIFTLMTKTQFVFPVNLYMKRSTTAEETARQQKFRSHNYAHLNDNQIFFSQEPLHYVLKLKKSSKNNFLLDCLQVQQNPARVCVVHNDVI